MSTDSLQSRVWVVLTSTSSPHSMVRQHPVLSMLGPARRTEGEDWARDQNMGVWGFLVNQISSFRLGTFSGNLVVLL